MLPSALERATINHPVIQVASQLKGTPMKPRFSSLTWVLHCFKLIFEF